MPCPVASVLVRSSLPASLPALISDAFKQELLSRVDIVDVIDPRVPLKKAGANFSARCPFHTEKTPSFSVSPAKQFYYCFGCGATGNAITFLIEYSGLGYVDAVRELADSVGMKMPAWEPGRSGSEPAGPSAPDLFEVMATATRYYREQLKASPGAIDYLRRRGLTGQIAARFGIGYAPADFQALKGAFPDYEAQTLVDCGLVSANESGRRYDRFRDRIMFPIINQRGQVIGFGGRVLGAGEPKYLNSPETTLFEKRRELYGIREARDAIRRTDRVIVVEGYMDVVALAQHGVENAVATLGTATTRDHLMKLLRQAGEIVFCFDGDKAGRKAAWHALEVALATIPDGKVARFLFLPPEHDPDSFVRERGADAFNALAAEATPLSVYLARELAERHPPSTAEGRASLVTEARPLLQGMVAPALQMQLVREVAAIAALPEADLERLVGLAGSSEARPARPGGERSRPWRPAEGMPFLDRSRMALNPDRQLERTMLQCVLAFPDLASSEGIHDHPSEFPEGRALDAVVASLREEPVGTALLIDRFRGSEHAGTLEAICRDLLTVNHSADEARGELASAYRKLHMLQVEKELHGLLERHRAADLPPAERQAIGERVRDLIREKVAIRQSLVEGFAGTGSDHRAEHLEG